MPSPFPGMDPYLEHPQLWPDVHHRFIDVASELLLASLRPRYFVQIDERLYVASDAEERAMVIPDVTIREVWPRGHTAGGGTGIAIEPGIEVDGRLSVNVHQARLRIMDKNDRRVVTVLEILSPTNKLFGSAGQADYQEKKDQVLSSETNFVEIDLLRDGVPLRPERIPNGIQYIAQVWRWNGEEHHPLIWPMSLTERLKPIPIPVRLGDRDGVLDLQAMLNTAYERAGYELRIDYNRPPIPPLPPVATEWANQLIAHNASRR